MRQKDDEGNEVGSLGVLSGSTGQLFTKKAPNSPWVFWIRLPGVVGSDVHLRLRATHV